MPSPSVFFGYLHSGNGSFHEKKSFSSAPTSASLFELELTVPSRLSKRARSTTFSIALLIPATMEGSWSSIQVMRNFGWKTAASWQSRSSKRGWNRLSRPSMRASTKGLQKRRCCVCLSLSFFRVMATVGRFIYITRDFSVQVHQQG